MACIAKEHLKFWLDSRLIQHYKTANPDNLTYPIKLGLSVQPNSLHLLPSNLTEGLFAGFTQGTDSLPSRRPIVQQSRAPMADPVVTVQPHAGKTPPVDNV